MGHRFDWIHPGAIAISPHELLDKLIAKAIEYEVIEKGHCKRVGEPPLTFWIFEQDGLEWSRFPGHLFKHLQAASRSKSQGAIYPFLECNRCLL